MVKVSKNIELATDKQKVYFVGKSETLLITYNSAYNLCLIQSDSQFDRLLVRAYIPEMPICMER